MMFESEKQIQRRKISRKKKIIIAIVSVFLVLILGHYMVSRLRWASEGEFHGTLTFAHEHQDFQPDNSFEHWWLDGYKLFIETIRTEL